jgi:hypothetical protein
MKRRLMVETRFRSIRNEQSRTIAVRIGIPSRRRTGEWATKVRITGIVKPRYVFGVDALQALALALDFVGNTFYAEQGRGLRLQYITGETVPLAVYFRLREFRRRCESKARSRGNGGHGAFRRVKNKT